MSEDLTFTYQCIDARTASSSNLRAWQKLGYEGFGLTTEGMRYQRQGIVFIDNGQRENATHFVGENTTNGMHIAVQQAGPDVNLVKGSAFISNETHEATPINVIQTAQNLEDALDKAKFAAESRTAFRTVVFNVVGHELCGDIALHCGHELDVIPDGYVTVAEYLLAEDRLRESVRERQAQALLQILGNVFQQGGSYNPIVVNMVSAIQRKHGDDYLVAQGFVNSVVGQTARINHLSYRSD